MRQEKLASLVVPPPMPRDIGSVLDGLESRLKDAMRRDTGATSRAVMRNALEYAANAHQQIAELKERVRQLEALSETDELTGLLNRRGFRRVLERSLANANRHDEQGLLAFFDLDNFKRVNDQLGHAAGDEMLAQIGKFIQGNVRLTDYAARIGGDEFAILFVHADHQPARDRARDLAQKLNRLAVVWQDRRIHVSASAGLAYYNGTSKCDELMQRADRAMYACKSKRHTALAS